PARPSAPKEFVEDGPLDRPALPLRSLVLVREHRGAHAEDRELGERGVIGRAPGLVPGVIPPAQLARVAMAALAVGDLDLARHDRREALKLLADRAQRRRRKAELGLHLV